MKKDIKTKILFVSAILFFGLFGLAQGSQAANWYVRPSGGSGSGTSWTAAWNGFSGINWASISAGDTIWVAGGSYGALSIGKSGASSAAITIARARSNSAECTGTAGWSSSYDSDITQTNNGVTDSGHSYVVVSGMNSSDGIGWVQSFSGDVQGNVLNTGYNTLSYMEIAGNGGNYSNYGQAIWSSGGSGHNLWSHLKIHGWTTGMQIQNHHYDIVEYTEFYAIAGGPQHPNTIYMTCQDNGIIRYSIVHDSTVSGTGFAFSDGDIFCHDGGQNWQIYGNVMYANSADTPFCAFQRYTVQGFQVYNNTIIFPSGVAGGYFLRLSGASWGSGNISRNNIVINDSPNVGNTYSNNLANPATGIFTNYASHDFHIVSTIGSGYPRNAGTALTSDGYINYDMDGNLRGADGTWDIGAFEYTTSGGSGTDTTAPAAPTGLAVN